MINKKNLWFLTLFSLVLVLSIYYVTMPNDLLASATNNNMTNSKETSNKELAKTKIEESDVISALKVEDETETNKTIATLEETITNNKSTTEEKNKAYETIKTINNNNALEDEIEKKINKEYSCNAFTKIEESKIKVVVNGCDESASLANNIMRLVQSNFDNKMYISVEFKS